MISPEHYDGVPHSDFAKLKDHQVAQLALHSVVRLGHLSFFENLSELNETTPVTLSGTPAQSGALPLGEQGFKYGASWVEKSTDRFGYGLSIKMVPMPDRVQDFYFGMGLIKVDLVRNELAQPSIALKAATSGNRGSRVNKIRARFSDREELEYTAAMLIKLIHGLHNDKEIPPIHPGVEFLVHLIDVGKIDPNNPEI